jgi:LuxR family maltose regulon positive regulatory protein
VIAYEQNDLEQAELSAQRAALLCRDWDNAAMAMRVELTRAQIAAAQGERSAAQAILDDAERLARDSRDPRRSRLVLRWRLRLALAVSDMVSARRWLEGIVALNLGPPHYVVEISLGRFALADGHPDRACEHLGRARAELEQMHYVPVLIETLLLESLARFSRRPTGWLAPLGRALELGHAGGFLRTFLDEGPEVLSLLRRSALMPEYVDQLLVAGARPSSDLTEIHLTDRERQILYLLSAGLSNRDLADRLVIAESTLKRHISNLYLKLAVHSRTQALARASELRLL